MRNQFSRNRTLAWCAPAVALAVAVQASAADLDQRVEIALGRGDQTSLQDRMDAVHSLYTGLSQAAAQALYDGIIAPTQPQGMPLASWAALYNDALNAIGTLEAPLDQYPEHLLALVGQKQRPVILRDYALQHLLTHLEFKLDAAPRARLLDELEPLVRAAPGTTLPATYLLGIWPHAGQPGYPDAQALGKRALALATNPEAFVPNRISAIQICGQLGYLPALPAAREIAADSTMRDGLRAAAIATIGDLSDGNQDDRKFLTHLKRWGHPRLQYAASESLKRLENHQP